MRLRLPPFCMGVVPRFKRGDLETHGACSELRASRGTSFAARSMRPDHIGSVGERLGSNSKALEPDLALDFALRCGSGRNDQLQPLGITTGRGHAEFDFYISPGR